MLQTKHKALGVVDLYKNIFEYLPKFLYINPISPLKGPPFILRAKF